MFKGLFRKASIEERVRTARDHLRADRLADAVGAADAVLASSPGQHEALYVRGTARLELGRPAEALGDLKEAARLRPDEPTYAFNLAVAHWHLGDAEASADVCRRIVARHDFREAHHLLANIGLGGEGYFQVLARLHEYLKPALYLEVGVADGASLRIASPKTRAIGVDPAPVIQVPVGPNKEVFEQKSDDFFARGDLGDILGGRTIDMAFIDGMHRFEYALRDFANIERLSRPDTVVLVHDCWPLDRSTAERERVTQFWSGDIWRLTVLLRRHRPDLVVRTIGTPPTGLGIILNLDPSSRLLLDRHDPLVEEGLALDYGFIENDREGKLAFLANDWDAVRTLVDSRRR